MFKGEKFKLIATVMLCFTMLCSMFIAVNAVEASNSKIIIHYYCEDSSEPNIYYWNSLPNNKDVKWPGKKMTVEENNWFVYEFDDVTKINFLFNYDDNQTEDLTAKSGEYWYKDGTLSDKNPQGDSEGGKTDPPDEGGKTDPPDDGGTTNPPTQGETKPGTALWKTDSTRTDMRDDSIYFVITTRFYDGCLDNNYHCIGENGSTDASDPAWRGDFKGLIEKLDYIKALGFSAIWITPIVENRSDLDYHGYHAYNFTKIDSRYETEGASFQDLINECHKKGIKLIQDVVFNHTTSWGEENLHQITDNDFKARENTITSGAGDSENIYHHNGYCGSGDYDNYGCQIKTIDGSCFDLNTENPKVYNYLNDCYKKYIGMGVDGFRVDTAKHISRLTFNKAIIPEMQKAGGDNFFMFGEICTKGHDVWYRDAPPISTAFYTWKDDDEWLNKWSDTDEASNQSLVAEHYEANLDGSKQPKSDNALLKGNEYHKPDYSKFSGLNVIDFQMHWSFKEAGSAFEMAKKEDPYINDSTNCITYVDSHDYGPDGAFDIRYPEGTEAWAENLDLMFTFRGIPCLYYGSEIEFQKNCPIDKGGSAALATTGRAYFGDKIEGTVNTTDFGVYDSATGAMAETLNYPLAKHIQRLNLIRRAVPALRKGQYSIEGISGGMAYKRRYTDSNVDSFVCVTISGDATFEGIPDGNYVEAITGESVKVSGGKLEAKCSGKGNMRVYVLDNGSGIKGKIGEDGKFLTK